MIKRTKKLPIEGAHNLRELGGYAGHNNKRISAMKLFRADNLSELSKKDLGYLAEKNLTTFVDFRSDREVAKYPDQLPITIKQYMRLPIDTGSLMAIVGDGGVNADEAMTEYYRMFVKDYKHVYRRFFEILQRGDKSPLLFHCTAGKDRTGYAAAMILSALGVDREVIFEDYLLTTELLKGKFEEELSKHPHLEPFYTVKPKYLEATFEVIDIEFGGVERYLSDYLDVNIDLMRSLYLE